MMNFMRYYKKFNLKLLKIALIVSLLIITASCEYQPTGTNFVNVDSVFTAPLISIDLPPDGETIAIQSGRDYNLNYNVSGDLSKFYKVVFYIDTNQVNEFSLPKSYLRLNKTINTQFEEHTLRMVVLNHSGTNSMADKLNAEGFYYSKSWRLIYYNSKLFNADSISYEIENGYLKFKWKNYPFYDFLKYEVTKTILEKDYSGLSFYKLPIINDQNQNWIIDKSYVGEKAQFEVNIHYKTSNQGNYEILKFPTITIERNIPTISVKKISDTSLELNWNKSPYYNSLKFYELSNTNLFSNFNIDANLGKYKLDNLPLGVSDNLKISFIPEESIIKDRIITNILIMTGDTSFQYSEFETKVGDYLYYSKNLEWYSFKLYKYSLSQNKILDSTNFRTPTSADDRITISPSGKHIVFRNNKSLYCCLDGNLTNPIIISDISLSGKESSYGFDYQAISDNGILAASLDKLYIFDLVNNKLISTINETCTELSISSNGDYLAYTRSVTLESKLLRIDKNNSISIVKDQFKAFRFTFDPYQNDKLYFYDMNDKNMKNFNCSTLNENIYDNYFLYYIDVESGLAQRNIGSGNIDYEIIDLRNGLKRIYSYKSKSGSGYIKGNYIYFYNGTKCKFR
jgi:hypothetical protein